MVSRTALYRSVIADTIHPPFYDTRTRSDKEDRLQIDMQVMPISREVLGNGTGLPGGQRGAYSVQEVVCRYRLL